MTIAQQNKVIVQNQQEGRQIITGVVNFSARDCYTGATINSEASRIDANNVHLEFTITGGAAIVFQGTISGGWIIGKFTSEVTCSFVSPIITTDTSETSTETKVLENADGTPGPTETTTTVSGGTETSGGEVVDELVADSGAMNIQRQ